MKTTDSPFRDTVHCSPPCQRRWHILDEKQTPETLTGASC